jgi:hypothetical protein
LSSLYCDLRGQGKELHLRQGQSLFQPIQDLSVQSDSAFGDCGRYLQATDCGDSNLSRSSYPAVCSTAETRRIAYPPKPCVGVQHKHHSTFHSSSNGATMSP